MTRTVIDLCSGLGGFSESFLRRGWDVIRIDNDPKFKDVPNTVIMDIREASPDTCACTWYQPDVILCSPPCIEFSKASMPKTWISVKRGCNPSTDLMEACKRIIDAMNPRFWVIENVRGAVPYFKPLLGKPTKKVGSRYLWGEFPIFWVKPQHGKWKLPPSPDRPALRSLIPYALSEAICIACERELGA